MNKALSILLGLMAIGGIAYLVKKKSEPTDATDDNSMLDKKPVEIVFTKKPIITPFKIK